jgi:prepilin-type N-terminal cleavage/methylation domain-containing protein
MKQAKRQGFKSLIGKANHSTPNPLNPGTLLYRSIFDIRYSKFGSKGFTLIELIIFIIIAGIFLPATYVAFSASMRNATQPEDYTKGRFLAEQAMEMATKRFSTNYVSNPTQVQTDVNNWGASGTPCTAIGVTVPSGFACTFTPSYITTLGGLTLSANNYVQLLVTINTPQGNTFTSTGMVTNHGF